jgi:hypothetical protein
MVVRTARFEFEVGVITIVDDSGVGNGCSAVEEAEEALITCETQVEGSGRGGNGIDSPSNKLTTATGSKRRW